MLRALQPGTAGHDLDREEGEAGAKGRARVAGIGAERVGLRERVRRKRITHTTPVAALVHVQCIHPRAAMHPAPNLPSANTKQYTLKHHHYSNYIRIKRTFYL